MEPATGLLTADRPDADPIGDRPVLTYNARFVRHMIKHAAKSHGLPLPLGLWIDIASAIADVFALAQMLQTLLAYCKDVGIATLDDLERAPNARVWLHG
jgi:formyltetrahydrofolate synthetase